MENDSVLEESLDESFLEKNYEMAGIGQRLFNFLIDLVVINIFLFFLGMGMGIIRTGVIIDGRIIFYITYLMYYFICELSFGKTAGKIITRTMVVSTSGKEISAKQAFIRAISRFVPFEMFSIFFYNNEMWHDKWSDTQVVKIPR